jgi:hypothetical protein
VIPITLPLEDLARGVCRRPGWRISLRFSQSRDEERDHERIRQALPWLGKIEYSLALLADLQCFGLAVIFCEDEGDARQLYEEVRGCAVLACVFDPDGKLLTWERPWSVHSRRRTE